MSVTEHHHRETLRSRPIESSVAGVGDWHFDLASKRYQGSSECCRLRRLPPASHLQQFDEAQWWQDVHHADRSKLEKQLHRLQGGAVEKISIRYRVQDKHPHWRWILTRANISEYDVDNRPLRIVGVDVDITELFEEEPENKQLREQAERSEIALASAEQGLWHLDFRLGIRTESDTWRTMRGHAANSDYSSGNRWHRDIHPDDIPMVMNHNNIRRERFSNVINFTYRQRHADGSWRWIWSRGKIIERDSDGTPIVLIGTDTDITQIKEAETRHERLSKTFEIAIQAAGMGVWEWTLNAQVNVWDRRTREIFGTDISSEYVSHERFIAMVHPDDRTQLNSVLNSAVVQRMDISADYRIIHPQKGVRYLKAKAKCHLSFGEAPRYVGIVWDITDMVHAEQERSILAENLNHAQRLQSIGELTGGIAHDFNNLLAIISGNAELMSMTLRNESKFLDAIISASQRGATLTQGLLAYSRKQTLCPAAVDLGKLVNELCAMLDRTLGSTISIKCTLAEQLWHCEADPAQVENALINLIVNARDAMPKGGSIIISIENDILDGAFASLAPDVTPGDFVKVSVTDSGTGMSEQVVSKSIDPFFTLKKPGEGHGLGLSMVFGFIKQSNGHMTINSEQGKGTVVNLYLPRYTGDELQIVDKHEALDHLPTGNGETILLVEDEPSVQEMIDKTLEFLGYKVICVTTGTQALQQLARPDTQIDLVLTDIVLSEEMNGFELGQELRKHFVDMRIIYISGYAQDALKKQGAENNNVNILQKPFSVEQLAAHISQHLKSTPSLESH